MKLWIDDVRKAPPEFVRCRSVDDALDQIRRCMKTGERIELLAIDHDAGDYFQYGGDFIKIMDFLEQKRFKDLKIFILSANPVAVQKYRKIIQVNGWTELHQIP